MARPRNRRAGTDCRRGGSADPGAGHRDDPGLTGEMASSQATRLLRARLFASLFAPSGACPMPQLSFGILLWNQATDWPDYLAAVRRVDRLGYAHLWAWDHLYAIFGDP